MSEAADGYQIAYPGSVKDKLKAIIDQATKTGKLERFHAAAVAMDRRLRQAPWDFGELVGGLTWLKLPIHVGFARPVRVRFAIHEEKRMVWAQSIDAVTSLD